jgi:hypothetical protein
MIWGCCTSSGVSGCVRRHDGESGHDKLRTGHNHRVRSSCCAPVCLLLRPHHASADAAFVPCCYRWVLGFWRFGATVTPAAPRSDCSELLDGQHVVHSLCVAVRVVPFSSGITPFSLFNLACLQLLSVNHRCWLFGVVVCGWVCSGCWCRWRSASVA